jgi:magnesium-transporting ATPase (P-type)
MKVTFTRSPINASSSLRNEELEMERFQKNDFGSLGVVKRFEFSSALQRMSILTLNHESKTLSAFVKGSPEMIHSLSTSKSIPEDFHDVLEKYTQDGLRVLALSYKEYDNFGKKSDSFTFLNFIIFVEFSLKSSYRQRLDKSMKTRRN